LTNGYLNNKNNNKKKNDNKVKSKPLELYELAGKKSKNNSRARPPSQVKKQHFKNSAQTIRKNHVET
jgi:hypothetical protein